LFVAIVKFILPFILQSPVYELHRDEYLYYAQGQHFALGYLEKPSTAIMAWHDFIVAGWFIILDKILAMPYLGLSLLLSPA
jgi:hypothetical protein